MDRLASNVPVRNAATVILVRRAPGDAPGQARVLMGQRGAGAAFMPNKFVFPGGAVDPDDFRVPLTTRPDPICVERLSAGGADGLADALVAAAIRELWEEAGLILGRRARWPGDIPEAWQGFADTGHLPDAAPLRFVFRAITPPGRPRRFDARFFAVDADALASRADDFSAASDELSHLQWVPLDKARGFDLPFITEVVLAEVAARLPDLSPPASVPFFNNADEQSLFERLAGRAPLS